jgi:hypothetical protein
LAQDSIARQKQLNKTIYRAPRRASIMSAILPGLGQAYNRKYWKIPVIYGGIGAFTYLFIVNHQEYRYYRDNLRAIHDGDPATINNSLYGSYELQQLKQSYKRTRDFGGIGIAIIYVLNIIDANVDGHLKTFDVSDDLSLNLRLLPVFHSAGTMKGAILSLNLKFK